MRSWTNLILWSLVVLSGTGVVVQTAAAATITVDEISPGVGAVVVAPDGLCSIREAIINANANNQSGSAECTAGSGTDTIVLPSNAIFTLGDAAVLNDAGYGSSGLPHITSPITIEANGSTITRDSSVPCTLNGTQVAGEFRILRVDNAGSLTLEDATLTNGCADGAQGHSGGAIHANGDLVLRRSSLIGNMANSAGGGLHKQLGTVTIEQSTLASNSANLGGAVRPETTTAIVRNSTISGNHAISNGGGLWVYNSAVTLENVTFSANTASGLGGGIYATDTGFVTSITNAKNTIFDGSSCFSNGGAWSAEGANFDSGTSCADFFNASSPGTFTPNATLDLDPLADNGGPTMTHAIGTGSQVIDAVPDGECTPFGGGAAFTTDQRGEIRPLDGNGDGTALCDAGAFEVAGLTIDDVTVTEDPTTATFTISRGPATVGISTVQADTADGSATAGADYTAVGAQTVTIPDGASSATIDVPILEDLTDEGASEAFFVNLSNASHPIADAQGVGTITDDDTAGVTLSMVAVATSETGTTDSFTAVLDVEPTADVTLTVTSGDTTEGLLTDADETDQGAVTLTFTPANWNVAQIVTVTGQDDALADGNQTYNITTTTLSTDPLWDDLAVADVTATNIDDETSASDGDGDGVDNTIEDGGPNGGDGNGDGIPDSMQPHVATFPAANGNGYITVISTCELREVAAVLKDGFERAPVLLPYALVEFRLPCASADLTVLYHAGDGWSEGMGYWKYGPETPGQALTRKWYELNGAVFDTTTVAGFTVARARFTLTDGQLGDDTGVDGEIVDQGGPGAPVTPIPTASEWMLLMLALALALAGARSR